MDKPRLPGFTGTSSLYRHDRYPGITQSPTRTLVLPQMVCFEGPRGGGIYCCDCPAWSYPFCSCEKLTGGFI